MTTRKTHRRRCAYPLCRKVRAMTASQRHCTLTCAKRHEALREPERMRRQAAAASRAHHAQAQARWLRLAEQAQGASSLAVVLRAHYRAAYRAGLSARRYYEVSDGLTEAASVAKAS